MIEVEIAVARGSFLRLLGQKRRAVKRWYLNLGES